MSESQRPPTKRMGRPLQDASFDMPDDFREALDKSSFFDVSIPAAERWRNLPLVDRFDRIYRVRAATQYALSRMDTAQFAKLIDRSWKQFKRYLAGADIPTSVIEHLSVAANLPAAWIIGGVIPNDEVILEGKYYEKEDLRFALRGEAPAELDVEFFARVQDRIARSYKAAGVVIQQIELARLAAKTYSQIVAISRDPAHQDSMLQLVEVQMADQLAAEKRDPSSRKRQA